MMHHIQYAVPVRKRHSQFRAEDIWGSPPSDETRRRSRRGILEDSKSVVHHFRRLNQPGKGGGNDIDLRIRE